MSKKLRIFALISYFFIFFMGSMIAMPLFSILLFSFFDIEMIQWTFYAIIGLSLLLFNNTKINDKDRFLLNITSFILLLMPIIDRLLTFEWHWFNFPMFYVPLILFIIFYLMSLYFQIMEIPKSSSKTK